LLPPHLPRSFELLLLRVFRYFVIPFFVVPFVYTPLYVAHFFVIRLPHRIKSVLGSVAIVLHLPKTRFPQILYTIIFAFSDVCTSLQQYRDKLDLIDSPSILPYALFHYHQNSTQRRARDNISHKEMENLSNEGKDAMNSINRSRHENIVYIRLIPCEVYIVSFRAKGTKVHDYYNVELQKHVSSTGGRCKE